MKAHLKRYDLDNRDDSTMWDETLDEAGTVEVAGLTFSPSNILKNCDKTAYRCGFNDYVDGLPERWICEECDKEHDSEEEANDCCREQIIESIEANEHEFTEEGK